MHCRNFLLWTLACGLGGWLTQASAQPGRASADPARQTPIQFDVNDGLKLSAVLALPAAMAPKAVVVILHGGGGIGILEQQDVAFLLANGFATVVVDSFTGRGFRFTGITGAGPAVRPADRAADAFAVLKALKTQPDLAGKRWLLFGRSHGASAAMVSATSWAKATYAPDGPSFDGYIALYPGCNASYPEQAQANAPVRIHVGLDDDLTPAKPCLATIEGMKSNGIDASATAYPGAHHAFDLPDPVRYFPQWFTVAKCDIRLPSVASPLPTEEIAKCGRRGASMGANAKATADFRRNLLRELELLAQ